MRPLFLLSPLILFATALSAQKADSAIANGKWLINNTELKYTIYAGEAGYGQEQYMVLYRGKKTLLKHTTLDKEPDCNSISLELGDVATTDTSIIFYSYWAWVGGCCGMPYGARKQEYAVGKNGQLALKSAVICLERYKDTLALMPEKSKQAWKAKVESEYAAKFVTGEEATSLLAEAKTRVKKRLDLLTAGWENDRHGYRY